MKVPTDREGNFVTFELKDIDYDIYMAVSSLIEKKKVREAVFMFLDGHKIGGDGEASIVKTNFIAFQSAQELIMKMLDPVPGELKKN